MDQHSSQRQQIGETIQQLRELINKLQLLENEYLKQEEKLFIISEFANDWEYWQAPDGHYKYVSPSCKIVTGYKQQDFYDDPDILKKIIAFDNWDKWNAHSHSMAKNGLVNPIEFKIHTKDGKSRWIHHICQTVTGKQNENLGIRGSNRDITELKTLQKRLKHMAGHDILTGLPNRSLFLEHLNQTIKQAKRNSTMFAVVFIDLDDFKSINDTHGHEAGDTVLKKLASTLTGTIRKNDIMARLGGDEFIGLFNVTHDTDITIIKEKIFNDINSELQCPRYNIGIHYSLGVSIYPVDGTSVDTLLKKADQAMYKQKELYKTALKRQK